MAISDAQFAAWLKDDSRNRTVLCRLRYMVEEAGAPVEKVFLCSDRGYQDYVNHESYPDYIQSVPQYSRALSGDRLGAYTSSVGSLELDNDDGVLDFLLTIACDGSEIDFYYGDQSWEFADFRFMFTALAVKISASSWDKLSVQLKDTSLLLDKSIGGEIPIGGSGPNKDTYRPINFGYVHQAPFFVENELTLTYRFNEDYNGVWPVIMSGTDIVFQMRVFDRGIEVNFTDNADGTVSLDAAPDGEITGELLVTPNSANSAHRCISDAIDYFVGDRCGLVDLGKYFGPASTYEVRPDTGVAAWIDAGGQDFLIGLNITDKRNVESDLLPDLMNTGQCFWAIRRDGQFTYGRLRPNAVASLGVAAVDNVNEDDIINQLSITHADPTYYKYQILGSKNWKISSDFALALTPDQLDYVRRPGLSVIEDDFAGTLFVDNPQLYNKTLQVSPQIDTLLSGGNDDLDIPRSKMWMDLRRSISMPWLETLSFSVDMSYYALELGDVVTFKVPRFGYDTGRDLQVISINVRLSDSRIDLKLLSQREIASAPGGWTPNPIPPEIESGNKRVNRISCNTLNILPCIIPFSCYVAPFKLLDINCTTSGGPMWHLTATINVQTEDNTQLRARDYLSFGSKGNDAGKSILFIGNETNNAGVGDTSAFHESPTNTWTLDSTQSPGGIINVSQAWIYVLGWDGTTQTIQRFAIVSSGFGSLFVSDTTTDALAGPMSRLWNGTDGVDVSYSSNDFVIGSSAFGQTYLRQWSTHFGPVIPFSDIDTNFTGTKWVNCVVCYSVSTPSRYISAIGNDGLTSLGRRWIVDDFGNPTTFTDQGLFGPSLGFASSSDQSDAKISLNGLTMAIGGQFSMGDGSASNGHVLILQRTDQTVDFPDPVSSSDYRWLKTRSANNGANSGLGMSIQVSANGQHLLVGLPLSDRGTTSGNPSGRAYIVPVSAIATGNSGGSYVEDIASFEYTHTYDAGDTIRSAYGINVAITNDDGTGHFKRVAIATSDAVGTNGKVDIWDYY